MRLSLFKNFFDRFTKKTVSATFDKAPFLSPWYFSEDKPRLIKGGQKMKWKFIDKIKDEYVGVIALIDNSNDIFGFLNTYNYIHAAKDASKFLIWNRATKIDTLNPCVTMHLYDTTTITKLGNSDDTILEYFKTKKLFHFSNAPIATVKYFIEPEVKENRFSFPNEFKIFDPFLVVAEYEGLYNGSRELGGTLILEFLPKRDIINCYKQDWFNKGKTDFGYEWITRAIRYNDGLIHGQGIRISEFILDETGCQLKK
jgi:hypothetical protein